VLTPERLRALRDACSNLLFVTWERACRRRLEKQIHDLDILLDGAR
jgi:hypothetical protein